ncbi:MAG TPA: hypothetical protein VF060_13385 [Trebonia sp.]
MPLWQRQVIACRLFLDLDTAQTAQTIGIAPGPVQRQPDGVVAVTIRDMLNLAGLQQKLNDDGVPAVVIADEHYPASCVNYAAMKEDMASVITLGPGVPGGYAFVIHPAAIPSGSKLLLDVTRNTTVTSVVLPPLGAASVIACGGSAPVRRTGSR